MNIWSGQPAWHLTFVHLENAPAGADGTFLKQRQLAVGEQAILATGIGPKNELDTLTLRRAAAKAVRTARDFGAEAAVLEPEAALALGQEGITALVMGARLALLKPENFATTKEAEKSGAEFSLYINPANVPDCEAMLAETAVITHYNEMTRNLTNRPANMCTPSSMAQEMQKAAAEAGVECQVLNESQIKELKMEAFLAVGISAANPPRLIVLRYNGNPQSERKLAFIGKGITCDTGGYCIKPAGSMQGIRGDMAGGAAACSAILALASQNAKVNAVAVIPAAENRVSRDSYVPGDVIGSMSGKTIYVGNTDAEGRLLLADAITYAIQKEKATHLIDMATLTGAAYAFFGHIHTVLVSNNDSLADELMAAAVQSNEKMWRVPADKEYRDMLNTPYADISNISKGGCGTITAAMFLQDFTEGLPWAHLDIAGTAWVDDAKMEYHAPGATGVLVETLYRMGMAEKS